ncbi:hypothetical protein GCM10011332_14450 [Terasakiella brassicae]|uniref:Uncharacterized protein n=1 Tax=Terasakiella brassicae TaxID=1634917 RepID=A0A917F969_9PROT|nr:DciA family protein [Terasakiella brassicae]GGF61757.1 hypothetical protein GCM10011332_14450 [Terasakiella brassicae]
MYPLLDDFLIREERRRNRSLPKRFIAWLNADKGEKTAKHLERTLAKPGSENMAVQLLKKAEEAYKADDVYKKQDAKRKRSLKQFQKVFEDWLNGKPGTPYREEMLNAKDDMGRELARSDAERAFARANPHLLPDDYKDASKTRIRPVRNGYMKEVDDLTFDVIEPGLNQMGLVGADILRSWDKIVGQALAQNTRPERITFPPKERANATLFLKVRAGFNTIVQHHSAQIIFRINGHFGFRAVSEVRISKRPFDENETTGSQVSRKVLAQRVQPVAQLSPRMAELIHAIKDPEMRQAFEELGKVIEARNR